jgi:hypothetical protein
MEFYRKLGNSIFVSLVRILFGGKYTDLCYGYNAFWAHALPKLDLDVDGFEVETCMNIRALTADLSITEVSSFEYERIYGTSNLRTIPDGWRVLKTIFREYRAHMTRRLERLTLRKPSSVPMGSDETVMAALQFTLNEALYLMLHGSREMSPATCYTSLTALRATFETLMQQAVPSDVSAAEFGRAVQEAQRELNVRFSFEVSAGSAADQTEPPHLSDAYLSLPSQSAG